jgi:hypothetical protein
MAFANFDNILKAYGCIQRSVYTLFGMYVEEVDCYHEKYCATDENFEKYPTFLCGKYTELFQKIISRVERGYLTRQMRKALLSEYPEAVVNRMLILLLKRDSVNPFNIIFTPPITEAMLDSCPDLKRVLGREGGTADEFDVEMLQL